MTELWALSVHPQWRGSGTAQALARAALPTDSAYLWVLQGNVRAIAFYRRMSFTIDGATRVDESTERPKSAMLRGGHPRIAHQLTTPHNPSGHAWNVPHFAACGRSSPASVRG